MTSIGSTPLSSEIGAQLKCCPQCPAQFARVAHLNRHMRSHTQERPYQCDACHSEFTRSDLLAKHKRKACAGSSIVKKSRRKSCQACAESKIKCDLGKPCSKCVSRRKECIFFNDPVENRARMGSLGRQERTSDAFVSVPEDLQINSVATSPSVNYAVVDGPLIPLCEDTFFDLSILDTLGQTPVWNNVAEVAPGLDGQSFDDIETMLVPRYFGLGAHMNEPEDDDLRLYLQYFFSPFLEHVPMINPCIWDFWNQPAVVTDVMCACGAVFFQQSSPKASMFIDKTLKRTRGVLVTEFGKRISTSDEEGITPLIFAVVLLQHLGFFGQQTDDRESANLYHGMLVNMIRRTGILSRLSSWVPPTLTDPANLEESWKEWAKFEMIRRALFGAFCQDCCQCIYFSLPPIFRFDEFNFALPSDDALWKASSAREWYDLLQQPSIYGTASQRMAGINFQTALSSITQLPTQDRSQVLNPGSFFILLHALLRSLYESCLVSTSSAAIPNSTFAIQFALHNWLTQWLDNEECMDLEKDMSDDPPMWCNVLPFYWLAQVTLFAIQEGKPVAGARFLTEEMGKDELTEMKEWMKRIRDGLREGRRIPIELVEVGWNPGLRHG